MVPFMISIFYNDDEIKKYAPKMYTITIFNGSGNKMP